MILLRVKYTRHTATQKKKLVSKREKFRRQTKKLSVPVLSNKSQKNLLMLNLQLIFISRKWLLLLFKTFERKDVDVITYIIPNFNSLEPSATSSLQASLRDRLTAPIFTHRECPISAWFALGTLWQGLKARKTWPCLFCLQVHHDFRWLSWWIHPFSQMLSEILEVFLPSEVSYRGI